MEQKDNSYKAMQKRLEAVGREYRDAKRRMDLFEMEHTVRNNKKQYDRDCDFVNYIERILKDCDRRTRLIIRNEYLKTKEPNWYIGQYSSSAYYYHKKEAIKQFDRHANY